MTTAPTPTKPESRVFIPGGTEMVSGRMKIFVVDAKTGRVVQERPWQNNLILDQGLNNYATRSWAELMSFCAAGNGITSTKQVVTGTGSQSGTTVTLSGSAYSFVSGDVGSWVKWTSGEEAKITAFTNGTTVTVDRTQTVAAGTCCLYRCGQVGLSSEVKRTSVANATFHPEFILGDGTRSQATIADDVAGTVKLRRTYDHTAEVADTNYTEIGISHSNSAGNNLFSRVYLNGTVTVLNGQQLRVQYELTVTIPYSITRPTINLPISGWPYPYTISSITSTGSNFTITTSVAHHHIAGDSVALTNVKRPRFTISGASSTGSDFTLTTTAPHGRSPGDSITVEGMTPVGYNGVWTCAAGTTGSTIVVTTTANPGAGSVFGNVRQTEPGTWYNGTWTVASVTSTTIVVTSALNMGAAGEGGLAAPNLNAVVYQANRGITHMGQSYGTTYGAPQSPDSVANYTGNVTNPANSGFNDDRATVSAFVMFQDSNPSPPTYPQSTGGLPTPTTGQTFSTAAATSSSTASKGSYTNGNFYTDWTFTFGTGNANGQNVRGLIFQHENTPTSARCQLGMIFTQRQRKDSTHRLVIVLRRSWGRTLPPP